MTQKNSQPTTKGCKNLLFPTKKEWVEAVRAGERKDKEHRPLGGFEEYPAALGDGPENPLDLPF